MEKKQKLRCQDCGRIVDDPNEILPLKWCKECNGEFEVMGSEEDTYEDDDEDDEEEKEDSDKEETYKCSICKKLISADDCVECDECDEDFCEDCLINFPSLEIDICKSCIDKEYPREAKIEYKGKIVERPVKVYIDKEGKKVSSFDLNKKSRFD